MLKLLNISIIIEIVQLNKPKEINHIILNQLLVNEQRVHIQNDTNNFNIFLFIKL